MADEKTILEEEMEQNNSSAVKDEAINTEAPEVVMEEQPEGDAQARIVELEAKLEEAENRYYRLQADFDNARRRSKLDMEAAQKYRAQGLITELLPAIDNFERALNMESDNEQVISVLQGMEMVYRSVIEALKKEGAEQIDSVGKEFDPQYHHAVMQVSEEGYESNHVVEELQKGYILKDRVIRPAMVKVNQ